MIFGLFNPDIPRIRSNNTPKRPTSNLSYSVATITSESQFDSLLSSPKHAAFSGKGQTLSGKIIDSGINLKNLVLMIGASWCGPCRSMKPFFQELSSRYNATFAFVDVDIVPTISERLNAHSLPTFIIFGGNDSKLKEIYRVVGADKNGLVSALSKM